MSDYPFSISLLDNEPTYSRPIKYPKPATDWLHNYLSEIEKLGWIKRTYNSSYGAPVVLVKGS